MTLAQSKQLREKRRRRVRAIVRGTAERPRLAVFRSLQGLSVQAIDDTTGRTLCAAAWMELGKKYKNTVEGAAKVGELLAEKCAKAGIKQAVYDRGGYRYHGKVKALAEAARAKGLIL